jgi:membrane protease YdiL (CAAX protease family)
MVVGMVAGRPLGLRGTLGLAEAALAAPGVLALVLWGIPLARGLALARPTPRGWLFSVLAGAAFWVASVGLLELQYAVWAPPPGFLEGFKQLHAALRPSGPFDALLSIAAIALAPAVCEEILFRGVMLPACLRPFGTWGAILVSALAFGIIHADGLNLYRVPFAFAVALGLGVLRVRSGSLVPGLVAHAILNTITFSAVLMGVDTDAPAQADVLRGAGLFAGGLIASALLLRRFPRRPDAS